MGKRPISTITELLEPGRAVLAWLALGGYALAFGYFLLGLFGTFTFDSKALHVRYWVVIWVIPTLYAAVWAGIHYYYSSRLVELCQDFTAPGLIPGANRSPPESIVRAAVFLLLPYDALVWHNLAHWLEFTLLMGAAAIKAMTSDQMMAVSVALFFDDVVHFTLAFAKYVQRAPLEVNSSGCYYLLFD